MYILTVYAKNHCKENNCIDTKTQYELMLSQRQEEKFKQYLWLAKKYILIKYLIMKIKAAIKHKSIYFILCCCCQYINNSSHLWTKTEKNPCVQRWID